MVVIDCHITSVCTRQFAPCTLNPLSPPSALTDPPIGTSGSSWKGRKGYVQEALKEDGVRVPRNTAVLMCGQKEMAEDVRALCYKAGVLEGRCLTNF